MEEVERRRKPKPSVQGLREELSTELTPLSGKKTIFRDARKLVHRYFDPILGYWHSVCPIVENFFMDY